MFLKALLFLCMPIFAYPMDAQDKWIKTHPNTIQAIKQNNPKKDTSPQPQNDNDLSVYCRYAFYIGLVIGSSLTLWFITKYNLKKGRLKNGLF